MIVDVLYPDPASVGWCPVRYMAELAAELLEARLTVIARRRPARIRQLGALLEARRRCRRSHDRLLLVCPTGYDLKSLLRLEQLRSRYERIVAWVFDSFWTEHIPRFAKHYPLDHLFLTELDDMDTWRRAVGVPVDWAPWGSDVLRLGSERRERAVDLQRVGRQPHGWDDDSRTHLTCRDFDLSFKGRPPYGRDCRANQRLLMHAFSNSRFTLSFSNAVSPGIQTHPVREYITARWTDALAAGATVAGVPPRTPSVDHLMWPDALLDLGTVDVATGLQLVKTACSRWTPDRAATNYRQALRRLDWRWRFRDVATALGVSPLTLEAELDEVRALSRDSVAASVTAP